MATKEEILNQIEHLTVIEKLQLIEEIARSIRKELDATESD